MSHFHWQFKNKKRTEIANQMDCHFSPWRYSPSLMLFKRHYSRLKNDGRCWTDRATVRPGGWIRRGRRAHLAPSNRGCQLAPPVWTGPTWPYPNRVIKKWYMIVTFSIVVIHVFWINCISLHFKDPWSEYLHWTTINCMVVQCS